MITSPNKFRYKFEENYTPRSPIKFIASHLLVSSEKKNINSKRHVLKLLHFNEKKLLKYLI